MKNIFLLFVLGVGFQNLGLTQNDCPIPSANLNVSENEMNAHLGGGGLLIGNETGAHGLLAPDGPSSPLFSSAIWMYGFDQAMNVHQSIAEYPLAPVSDYFAGFYAVGQDTYCNDYDKIWNVKEDQILALLADYEDNNVVDNVPHANLLSWPASGNVHFFNEEGFDLPTGVQLAPFFDQNGDGIYDPYEGDFPMLPQQAGLGYSMIKGNLPAEMAWSVVNDIADVHSLTNSLGLGFEIQKLAWTYDCSDNPIASRTFFLSLKFINYSMETYTDTYLGLWNDFDLGGPFDDYLGCAPDLDAFYVYNADDLDEDFGPVPGYAGASPAFAVTLLNQSLHSFIGYGDNMPNPNMGGSVFPFPYGDFLAGNWADGSGITEGGIGYGGTTASDFWFNGNPSITTDWSMMNENISPQDFKALGSVGPLTFNPGQIFELDFAYSFHQKDNQGHLENVASMYEEIPLVRGFYDNQFTTICDPLSTHTKSVSISKEWTVFPNPVQHSITIFREGVASAKIALYDVLGRLAFSANIEEGVVDLPNLESGIYFLEVEWDGQKEIQRIIVEQ